MLDGDDRHELDLVLAMDALPMLTAPRAARSFVRNCAGLLDARVTETALLLTSEMVTNAVQHARTERVHLSLSRHGSALRIAVTDDDPEPPVLRPPDPLRLGGLGIRMVDEMATAWGVDVHGTDGKQVWFELDVD